MNVEFDARVCYHVCDECISEIHVTVKSAERVLQLLEFFADHRLPATVAEVSRRLGYPQSSTSMLLDTMVDLGYLHYEPQGRRFRPTLRVMLLGSWLQDELFGEGSLVSAMDLVRRTSGQSVFVGFRQGVHVRLILALRGDRPTALDVRSGQIQSACLSSVGKMLLSLETDADIARIARTANAMEPNRARRVHVQSLVDEIRLSQARGWAESHDYPSPAHSGIASLLPAVRGQPPLGLGLGTTTAIMQTDRSALVASLRHACDDVQRLTSAPSRIA